MERRDFVKASSLGLLGLGTPLAAFAAWVSPKNSAAHWLQQLILRCQARPMGISKLQPALQSILEEKLAHYQKAGFFLLSENIYLVDQESDFCLCPLSNTSSGNVPKEYLLLVYYLDPSTGTWRQSAVLNTFTMEALNKLSISPRDMLPIGYSQVNGQVAYKTMSGLWQTHTLLDTNKATTQIALYGHNAKVDETSFASLHRLTCS